MPATSLRELERELTELRAASAEPGAPPRLRASVMTHIAWVPEQWVEAATGTLAGLAERHPSRTILLFPQPDDPRDVLEGEVDFRCFVREGEQREVCSEVVSLRLCGRRASAPASVVMPLLVSDLPVFLRWRGPLPFGAPELDQLVGVADRLVVDSREWPDAPADLARLPELFDRIAVSDIAWARAEPWRCGIADLWPEIADASALHVAGPEPEASLLRSWLATRLEPRDPNRARARPRDRGGDDRRAPRPPGPARAADAERPALRPARGVRPRPDLRGGGTELLVGPDLPELASGWIAERARGRSRFRIALTGGSTPRPVYERLAELDLDWPSWQVWWSDERVVPSDHPDSNERLGREALLARVPILEAQIHPLRGLDVELPRAFDLVLLGSARTDTRHRSFPAMARSSPTRARSCPSPCRACRRRIRGSASRCRT